VSATYSWLSSSGYTRVSRRAPGTPRGVAISYSSSAHTVHQPRSQPTEGIPLKSRPPRGYTTEARHLWQQVTADWTLDPPALTILDCACRALERVREAQALLRRDGLMTTDRFGQTKAHPAAAIERDAKQTLLRNLRALNLDLEPLHDRPGRPGGS
jgi:phage terminase small subunit